MNKKTTFFLFLGSLLISGLYGLSFVLPVYIDTVGGDDVDLGVFLAISGISSIIIVRLSAILLERFSPWLLSIVGTLCYGIGLSGLGLLKEIGMLFYFFSLFLGAGWGLFYVASPIALSRNLNNKNRALYFIYYSAFISLGAGIGPIIFKYLVSTGIVAQEIFLSSIVIAIITGILFWLAGKYEVNKATEADKEQPNKVISFKDISSTSAIYPIIMVLLGACLLSSMMYFQIRFAEDNGMNYSIFFTFFTAAMIGSRIIAAPLVAKFKEESAILFLSIAILVSMVLFLFIRDNIIIYIVASMVFGFGYGLIYPLIKTIAVNVSHKSAHDSVLIYFTLSYFIGMFGFPLIAGVLIKYSTYTILISTQIGVAMLYLLTIVKFLKKTD